MNWIQKSKDAWTRMQAFWDGWMASSGSGALAERHLRLVEEHRAAHDIRMLVRSVREQNRKVREVVDALSEALRFDLSPFEFEEQVADALHTLRSVAPAKESLLQVMEQPLDEWFSEGELVDVFMAPSNPLEGVTERPTLMQAFAALSTMNQGSSDVSALVGDFEVGGPYGRYGLTEEEARVLATLLGFTNGWVRASGEDPRVFYEAVGEEIKRVGLLRASWSEQLEGRMCRDGQKPTVSTIETPDERRPVAAVGAVLVDGVKVADITSFGMP